jgi:hypothetical protein
MIDFESETVFPLTEAPRRFPGSPSLSSIFRWATKGLKNGRRLEVLKIGGRAYTSIEACKRFMASASTGDAMAHKQASAAHQNKLSQIDRHLEREGL